MVFTVEKSMPVYDLGMPLVAGFPIIRHLLSPFFLRRCGLHTSLVQIPQTVPWELRTGMASCTTQTTSRTRGERSSTRLTRQVFACTTSTP